jgi:uncharacterized OB-fold protein
MADEYGLLIPEPDTETEGFWSAAAQHELRIQRCTECNAFRASPSKVCPICQSEDSEWSQVSGKGKIYAWIEVNQAVLPLWRDLVPYNVVQVELDDAPNVILTGNVPAAAEDSLRVGLPVEVIFDDVAEGVSIPRWQLV